MEPIDKAREEYRKLLNKYNEALSLAEGFSDRLDQAMVVVDYIIERGGRDDVLDAAARAKNFPSWDAYNRK